VKLVRLATAVATGAALVVAGSAGAAAKPVCNLVTDPAGDASATTAAAIPGTNDGALDITSADLAASSKVLTSVIRVSKAAATSATAPNGYSALFTFVAPSAPDVTLYMRYSAPTPALAGGFEYGYDDAVNGLTPLGTADGVVDTAKNEIRISAPLNGFSDKATIKKGSKLGTFNAKTSRDAVAFIFYADAATSGSTYTVGALSCVKPGK
jgi:hypothetical protein